MRPQHWGTCEQMPEHHLYPPPPITHTHLPQELESAHKGAGAHLPSVHVAPLVDSQGQVPVALDPLGEHVVDDGLTGGPNNQGLLQVLATT
jgi:hypothetical protein